jgi:hypothetical protein
MLYPGAKPSNGCQIGSWESAAEAGFPVLMEEERDANIRAGDSPIQGMPVYRMRPGKPMCKISGLRMEK